MNIEAKELRFSFLNASENIISYIVIRRQIDLFSTFEKNCIFWDFMNKAKKEKQENEYLCDNELKYSPNCEKMRANPPQSQKNVVQFLQKSPFYLKNRHPVSLCIMLIERTHGAEIFFDGGLDFGQGTKQSKRGVGFKEGSRSVWRNAA